MGRTYGPRINSAKGLKALYATRTSTEWDTRFTFHIDRALELQQLVSCFEANQARLTYYLVGGEEYNTNDEHHVHCLVFFKKPVNRYTVLYMLQRHHVKNEYCVPRPNTPAYSYIGGYNHHTKLDTKTNPDVPLVIQWGILPTEQITMQQYKTAVKYGPTTKPLQQVKIKPIKVKAIKASKPSIPRRQIQPKSMEQQEKAITRLCHYQHMYSTSTSDEERNHAHIVINKIKNDYNL